MAIHLAFALALIETLALAGVLRVWARQVPGAGLLQLFLLGVALWILGNELPYWLGIESARWAMDLLATAPLSAAAFLHFCLVLCRRRPHRALLWAAYGAGALVLGLCLAVNPGYFRPHAGIAWAPIPNWAGWLASITWGVLAASGMLVLLATLWRRPEPALWRPVAAVALSCGWGLFCMLGYGIPALNLPWYPWPLLGLPLYPLILVYGMLRYRVFVANAWARRALAWALLLALGLAVVPLTLLLPVESRWLSGAAVAATCLALNGPVRRFAERLVYPGAAVSAADLARWRQTLSAADSLPALARSAGELLSQRLGTPIGVVVEEESVAAGANGAAAAATAATAHPSPEAALAPGAAPLNPATYPAPPTLPDPGQPMLLCRPGDTGWACSLHGWDDAPPGPRHGAELFGVVLADAAAQVQRAQQAGQRERERQLQARLAELGALAATVAHDLRNPLHIIGMAVALAPAETRQEVAEQVGRLSRLADDLLDYAKPWQLKPEPLDLAQRVQAALRRWPPTRLATPPGQPWPVLADPQRVDQVLHNLLANAHGAASARAHGPAAAPAHGAANPPAPTSAETPPVQIELEAAPDGATLLHVCDQGPGIAPELRGQLFQPFASRSPGGTGLGLAIVARIMAAHGGSVALTKRPPWTTCFTLRFPAPPPR